MPHSIHITTAEKTDRNGAIEMFEETQESLVDVVNVLADGGYTGKNFADAVYGILKCKVEVVKRSELHTFKVIPRRWVVERSFSWLEKCRRLYKNCEKLLESSLAMVQLAFIRILLCRKI